MSDVFDSDDTCTASISDEEIAAGLARVASDIGARYAVHGYLGRGAFATVWKVVDRHTHEILAVKRLTPEPRQAATYYREMRLLFRVRHERIVRLVNLMEVPGSARYLFLEHCAGGSLRSVMGHCRWTAFDVHRLVLQIADGLAEAHRLGLVHRDIKPENVLFTEPVQDAQPPSIKLADFGLARSTTGIVAPEGQPLRALSGSPAYMAPEQFAGTCGPAADLYALGVLAFELLHGHILFQGAPEDIAWRHINEMPRINPELTAPWPALLAELLRKDPGERPSSSELHRRLQHEPVGVPPHDDWWRRYTRDLPDRSGASVSDSARSAGSATPRRTTAR